MSMNIYAGNLSYDMTEDSLKNLFETYGQVQSVKIIIDHNSGRSKGFGFVEMDGDEAGNSAVAALNGTEVMGRTIKVNQARPKPSR